MRDFNNIYNQATDDAVNFLIDRGYSKEIAKYLPSSILLSLLKLSSIVIFIIGLFVLITKGGWLFFVFSIIISIFCLLLSGLLRGRELRVMLKNPENREMIMELLKRASKNSKTETNINFKDVHGRTQLHEAAKNGNKAEVDILIAQGADVDVKDSEGYTPLHKAAYNGHVVVSELLICKGADVNARAVNGGTPLHNAICLGHMEVVKLLIAKGADINAKSAGGGTPFKLATFLGHKEIADILKKNGAI